VPLVLESSFGRAGEFSYLGLSWLQEAVVLVLGFVVIGTDRIVLAKPGPAKVARVRPALLAAAIGLIALCAWAFWDIGGAALRAAGAFLFRPDPVLATVLEARSPLRVPLRDLARSMTPWILWAPALWVGLLASAWRRRFANLGEIVILAIFPLSLSFFLVQFRFGVLLGVPLCALAGWGLSQAVAAVRRRKGFLLAAGTALAAIATPIVVAKPLSRDELLSFRELPDSAVAAFRWIRLHTPPTRYYDDPVKRPEYGVLCAWEDGHALTYFAHRPNVANPFGLAPWHIRGALRASEIFLDQDPGRAAARCDALSIRYMVTESTRGEIISLAVAGYGKQNRFARETPQADGSLLQQVYPPYFETLHARLAVFDGAAIPAGLGVLPALEGFRLVYESPEAGELVVYQRNGAPIVPRHTKVFERVKGARLEGSCAPGEGVSAAVEVETNVGRRFTYSTTAACGASGRFEMRVPYARSITSEMGAVGAYLLRGGAKHASVLVTESDVEEGRIAKVEGWR
jgi:asparagine N-glycosylation enzyme membrane subunit Stt3